MSRILTNNALFYLEDTPDDNTTLVPTAISATNPPVVTVADATGLTRGDVVVFADTGFEEIDGQVAIIGTVDGTANTFEAMGFDLTGTTNTLGASPKATVVKGADMIRLCVESITIGEASIAEIDLSDFCNPSLTMPGKETLGSITFHGWVDDEQKATIDVFRRAAADKTPRYFEILSRDGKVGMVGQISVGSLSWGLQRDSGFEFNVSGTQARKIDLMFLL
jgi:hypothetical protein